MPRLARLVVPGHPRHVTQRGNRRQLTFFSDGDYRLYKRYLAAACAQTTTAVWAWCLMPNHVHLLLVPAAADGLAKALGDTHRRYTRAINVREGWIGHLWQARFTSFVMDERHLVACTRYAELNPVRAGLAARPEDWPWSSARAHLGGTRDGLTDPGPLLERWPDWRAVLDSGLDDEARQAIRARELNGHPLGDEAFVAAVAGATSRPLAPRRRGRKPRPLWET
ncbi:MAG TPA: transposase [Allosphingosinicella sp.]